MTATAVLLLLAGCAGGPYTPAPIFATVRSAELRWAGSLPVLILEGSPYEMGYQHGSLLRKEVRASVANLLTFAERHGLVPFAGRWLVRAKLDQAWRQMEPHVPARTLEEMEGLADGAGIPLRLLQRVHALPDLTSVTCASSAFSHGATGNGRLIQIRNLDWAIRSGVQRYAAILVHKPAGRHPFVNVGWLGFIGVVTGVNRQGISVAEVGAESTDVSLKGVPMPFLLRRVLEEASDLQQAVELVRAGPRTVGYNYLFADAKNGEAVALETTRRFFSAFWKGKEPGVPHAVPVPDALVRSDWVLDSEVRQVQLACGGDPSKPGLESPEGSSAYRVRYRGQSLLLQEFHSRLDPEIAMAIARAIAPGSNIQSVVYAYPQIWVATADGQRPAAHGRYVQIDLDDLF